MESIHFRVFSMTDTQMAIPKNNRKFYTPGIISLAILPLVFCHYVNREIKQSTIYSIPVTWHDTASLNRLATFFPNRGQQYPLAKKYTEIILTGHRNEDKIKLAFAQIRIREILKTADTVTGVHFLFQDSSAYESIIGALDKLRAENAETFLALGNNIWFWYPRPDTTTQKPLLGGCMLCNDVIQVKPAISQCAKTKERIRHIWKNSWQMIVLYTGFIITIIILRRRKSPEIDLRA